MDAAQKAKIKMSFTGRLTVKNPDGTTRETTLRGEKLITEEEAKRHGYNPQLGGTDCRD